MIRRLLNRRYIPIVAAALFLTIGIGAYFIPTTPAYACSSDGSPAGDFLGWLSHWF